jgi:hypothetical protein
MAREKRGNGNEGDEIPKVMMVGSHSMKVEWLVLVRFLILL